MNKVTSKHILLTVLLLMGILAFLSLQKAAKQSGEKITIADAQQLGFALIYIADKKGYFLRF